jgi:HD-like signal output (HDOD) protein
MAFATPTNIPPASASATSASSAARTSSALVEQSRLLVHPASARVVLEILQSPVDVAGDLTRTILTDPALAAAVLRAANSAHLGYSRRIGGVRQASVMLGTSLVNSLAASRVADLVFDTDAPDYPDWLWLHSITTACAAAVLARRSGESADDAYTAGLLHEVGWLLGVAAGAETPDQDHAARGGQLLGKWNLPDRIAAAATQHHARPAALTGTLDRVVVAAHAFAAALGASSPERSLTTIEALQLVGLADARPAAITGEIEAELAAVTSDLTGQR